MLIESVINRNKMLHLGEKMLDYVSHMELPEKALSLDIGKCLIILQLGVIITLMSIMNFYNVYVIRENISFLMVMMIASSNIVTFYMLGNLVFSQFFAHFITREFLLLRLHLLTSSLETILDRADLLVEIKKTISNAFGMRLLLLLLQMTLNVSFCSYDITNSIVEEDVTWLKLVQISYMLLTVLIVNMVSLAGVTYSFDQVETKVSGSRFYLV